MECQLDRFKNEIVKHKFEGVIDEIAKMEKDNKNDEIMNWIKKLVAFRDINGLEGISFFELFEDELRGAVLNGRIDGHYHAEF